MGFMISKVMAYCGAYSLHWTLNRSEFLAFLVFTYFVLV
jgi:hypothetical protein